MAHHVAQFRILVDAEVAGRADMETVGLGVIPEPPQLAVMEVGGLVGAALKPGLALIRRTSTDLGFGLLGESGRALALLRLAGPPRGRSLEWGTTN